MFTSPRVSSHPFVGTRFRQHIALVLTALACVGFLTFRLGAQSADLKPVDAETAILDAFDKHPIVALGDMHGCQELYDLITVLMQRPELQRRVQDIVVEFGNALYQDVADRYISGVDVPPVDLARIWRDHTNPLVFDSPVYEQFFKTIRGLNAKLPADKRVRIHLGDPPIDWSKTTNNAEWGRMLSRRDSHFASVVERVVFTEKRKALLIIGGAHLVRAVSKENVTARLEAQHPGSLFVVIPHSGFVERNDDLEPRLAGWKAGSLALLQGTWVGALPPRYRWPQMKDVRVTRADGRSVEAHMEDVADAWLYVGPRHLLTEAMPFPGIYRDEYWNELQRRHLIMWNSPLDASSGDINTSARYYVRPR